MRIDIYNVSDKTRGLLGMAAAGILVFGLGVGLVARGQAGLSLFHVSAWAVALFAYFRPLRQAMAFALAAIVCAFLMNLVQWQGQAALLCQLAALLALAMIPSLFTEMEEQDRHEQRILAEHNQRALAELHAELAAAQEETHRENERAKAANAALKRLAE